MLHKTNRKTELAWALALIATLSVSSLSQAQEDSPNPSNSKPQQGVFDKIFGSSTTTPKNKPKVPATLTSGKPNRSGFLVPLKSFSRVFRGAEPEEVEEFVDEAPPRLTQPRIPREPFKNLPRVQERRERERERDTVDLRVEQIAPEQMTTPAPIVKADKIGNESLAQSKTNSKPVVAGNSKTATPDIVIESNSTSRRTAMDLDASLKITEISKPLIEDKKNAYPTSGTKQAAMNQTGRWAESKNLVDLGQQNEKPVADLLSTVSETKREQDNSSKKQADAPKATHSANSYVAKQAPTEKPVTLNSVPKSSTQSTVSAIHREMAVPGVRVTVNGPSSILVNEEGLYEVIAKNEGAESLNGLIVQIVVPPQVGVGNVAVTDGVAHPDNSPEGNAIVWEIGQIPPGATKSAALKLKTPVAEHFALGVEWTMLPQNAEMKIEVQQPQLAIALEGPSEVIFGKPQLYRIRVRNTGNADVRAVSVAMTAEPYGSNQSDVGDIAAGSERVVEVELTFQQSGTLPIVATASSSVSKVDARSAIDVQVRQSELVATMYGPTEFYQGSVIDYELELINHGSIAAVGTNCVLNLPAGAEVVSMPPGATRAGDNIKWEVKKLDPQEKLVFPLKVSLTKIGENQLSFAADCSSSSDAKAELKTSIDSIADLHLTVVDPTAPAPVGQPVVYEVVIANRGKKPATNVDVITQFSEGIEPIRLEGQTGRIVPGQAIFNSIPTIGANEKLVLKIHAEASKAGVHRFRVEVKSKGSDTDLLEEESTRYLATSVKGDRR
ncbi:MAG: hypothetical protein NTY15_04205 [Planctomycetota bacterium]|jgi:uncharacterized repeat protein (TIGR01451 family)|nr:hypothetical protein [Planctomycetota bacterium]